MKRIQTAAAVFLLLLAGSASATISHDKLHTLLMGQADLDHESIDAIYEHFRTTITQQMQPSSHYPQLSQMQRRAVFENKVREIIAHNSQPNVTFYKGINEYSDMTEEEFADYFHLVGGNQECSATHASVFGKDVTYS
jgi:hypothetical protein